ncbi:hypothetical protein ATER59S_05216 [Aquamicrobium terrae]
MDQHVRLFQLDPHLVLVGDEVGAEIAAVELHALDDFKLGLGGLGLLDGDDAFVADLLHGFRQKAADLGVAIGRDGAHLGDLVVLRDLAGIGLQLGHDGVDGLVDAALEVHRVHAGGDGLGTFSDDGLRQDGRGGGAVPGDVVGLGGDLAHHLGAHVLELVFQLDLLRHRHAVFGNAGRAERLVDDDVAALGAERHLDCIGEDVDAAQHPVARVGMELHFLGSHWITPSIGSFR